MKYFFCQTIQKIRKIETIQTIRTGFARSPQCTLEVVMGQFSVPQDLPDHQRFAQY